MAMAFVLVIAYSIGESAAEDFFNVGISSQQIVFYPKAAYHSVTLDVSGPDGSVTSEVFKAGSSPFINSSGKRGALPDGKYTYELRVGEAVTNLSRSSENQKRVATTVEPITQSGHFLINNGSFYATREEPKKRRTTADPSPTKEGDVVHADDAIITGSLCVGFDCLTDGTESFGFDTIKLKENNLRILFDDTSATAGFAANDWRITVNDSSSGGANYFSIDDVTGSKVPFKVMAGARSSSLFVSSTGRVGFGTATPVLNLHIVHGDTPSVRLDQDTSSGWTAQVWDLAGNESNFFIRDTTGGSKLPFRIQPGSPTNSLTVKSTGYVGIGTWSPAYNLQVSATGSSPIIAATRTDGAGAFMVGGASKVSLGSYTDHPLHLSVNSDWKLKLLANNSFLAKNGASLTVGGVWTDASSRELKENITELSSEKADAILKGLNPVQYNYKADKTESHIGFIAEDVPELVATKDRKGLSPMDIVAALTKSLQDKSRIIAEQQKVLDRMTEKLERVEAEMKLLKSRN
jgi:hypothetical protein